MKKRERKYHQRKKVTKTIVNVLTENIRKAIDDEIIKTLKKIAKEEVDNVNDLIPFNTK
jgi:hypothetical protein